MMLETLVSILSIVPVAPAFAATPDLKCPQTHVMPGAPENSVVVLIDGEIEAVAVMGETPSPVEDLIDPASVHRVEIACWNPETDELPARDGMPLILITSKEYAEAHESAVEAAVAAVLSFEEAHGRVPTGLGEVGVLDRRREDGPGPPESIGPELAAVEYLRTEDGWSVRNGGGPLAYRCSAEKGPATEPAVACEASYELAKRKLRARFERGAGVRSPNPATT